MPDDRCGFAAMHAVSDHPISLCRGPSPTPSWLTLTLGLAVHAVGVPSDVPYRLQGHGLTLAGQSGLAYRETYKRKIWELREKGIYLLIKPGKHQTMVSEHNTRAISTRDSSLDVFRMEPSGWRTDRHYLLRCVRWETHALRHISWFLVRRPHVCVAGGVYASTYTHLSSLSKLEKHKEGKRGT